MAKKYQIIAFLLLVLLENSFAQRAFLSTNLGNFTRGTRDEIMVGFKMRQDKMLTICIERWHSTIDRSDDFSQDHSNFGGRLQIGIFSTRALKKYPKWQYFERYFVVGGKHLVENVNFRGVIDGFGNVTFVTASTTTEKLLMAGVGFETGFTYKYHQFFVRPSMITGYMVYLNENNRFENLTNRFDGLQKGLRLYFPTLRFSVGCFLK